MAGFRFEFTGTIDEPDAILLVNAGASDVTLEFADVEISPLEAP